MLTITVAVLVTISITAGINRLFPNFFKSAQADKSDNEYLLESLEDLEAKIRGLIAIEDCQVSDDDKKAAVASINKMFGGVEVINTDILDDLAYDDLYNRLDKAATSGKKALKQTL